MSLNYYRQAHLPARQGPRATPAARIQAEASSSRQGVGCHQRAVIATVVARTRSTRMNNREAGSPGAKARSYRLILAAACLAFVLSVPTGSSAATPLDAEAYGITAAPKPGPVTEFQPIRSLPAIPFELPFDWRADPYKDRMWRFRLHTLRNFVDAALVARDFDYAHEVFLDWQRWHENCWWIWPVCFERATDQSWDDMATGIRASRLAHLLRSTDWQDERLIELAEEHAEKLRDPAFVADNHNHAFFQLHGLAALCLDQKLQACRGAGPYIERELHTLLDGQFTSAGMHRENSPGYHFFVVDNLSRMATMLRAFSPELDAVLARANHTKKWLVYPDQTLVLVGDTGPKLSPQRRKGLVIPEGDLGCRSIRTYAGSSACYFVKHFKGAGYVIVRSDWAIPPKNASMLFVQGGFFNPAHRDADDLSFEWFERGRKILSDSGLYALTDDEWRDYFDSTRAHNTVEVDRADWPHDRGDAALYGSAVERVERRREGVRIVMAVDHASLAVEHRREIDYRPGSDLTVIDTLRSDRAGPRRYVQWHHFPRAFELTGGGGLFTADDGELRIDVNVTSTCGEKTTYDVVKGQLEPQIQGWESLATRERHPRWALGVACEAQTASFTARFTLSTIASPENDG
jgi:hypothetical protein